MNHDTGMAAAINEAEQALDNGDVPIAAVVTDDQKIISRARSAVTEQGVSTAHAELLALEDAEAAGEVPTTLYTTLESCLMCLGAAVNAHVDTIVVGMRAPTDGIALDAEQLPWRAQDVPTVKGPVAAGEVGGLLERFVSTYPDHPGADYARKVLNG